MSAQLLKELAKKVRSAEEACRAASDSERKALEEELCWAWAEFMSQVEHYEGGQRVPLTARYILL
jgi:hypothetical protein